MAIVKHSPKFHREAEGGKQNPSFSHRQRYAMTREEAITILRGRLEEIRRRFAVRSISLFGSVVRDEARHDSDIDILVVFDGKPTFDAFMDLEFYLEDLLGARVDLVTENALRPQVRRAIDGERVDVA
jgi:predicted nucleotidyltransferase